MKTANEIIKEAGYATEKIYVGSYKGVFGGNCNHVVVLKNLNNQILHYENEIYSPAGRLLVYSELIKSGDILAPCFSFK